MEPASLDAPEGPDRDGLSSCPRCGHRALRHNVLRHLRRAKACSPRMEGSPSISQARAQYGIQPEGARPARVPCDACGKTFSCNQALQRHVQASCTGETAVPSMAAASAAPASSVAASRQRGPRRLRYADLSLPEGTERCDASCPDISHVSAEMLDNWSRRPLAGLANLVIAVWFNPAVPQNMTYDWINTCHDDALRYTRGKWKREKVGTAVESLWWDAFNILDEHLDRHPSSHASLSHEAVRILNRLTAGTTITDAP